MSNQTGGPPVKGSLPTGAGWAGLAEGTRGGFFVGGVEDGGGVFPGVVEDVGVVVDVLGVVLVVGVVDVVGVVEDVGVVVDVLVLVDVVTGSLRFTNEQLI
jgi:hypothetical protein